MTRKRRIEVLKDLRKEKVSMLHSLETVTAVNKERSRPQKSVSVSVDGGYAESGKKRLIYQIEAIEDCIRRL